MANPEHLAILQRGAAAWNAWRQKTPTVTPDLSGISSREHFQSRTMLGVSLSRVNLSGANLSGVDLTGIDFSYAHLDNAKLASAGMRDANLYKATLKSTDLHSADLRSAQMTGAVLSGACLAGADLRNACLLGSDLNSVDFVGANLRGLNLEGANLSLGSLQNVDMYGANLRRADLRKADLRSANLSHSDLSQADLSKAIINGASFRASRLEKSTVQEVTLGAAYLSGTYIDDNMAADKLQLPEISFREAYMVQADFRGSDLTRADLSDTDLSYADLRWTHLSFANLRCSRLDWSDLRNSDLVHADLSKASLTGCKLYGTARDDWIIKGVTCKYAFWDAKVKDQTPPGREFESHEFEQLYEWLPAFDYYFENGFRPFDPLIMDRVVQDIRKRVRAADLRIEMISVRGFTPFIRFTVAKAQYVQEVEPQVRKDYAKYVEHLESEIDWLRRQLADGNKAAGLILKGAIERIGHKVHVGTGGIAVVDGQGVTIQMFREKAEELKTIVQDASAKSTRKQQVKKKLVTVLDGAVTGIAKDQLKDTARQIYELGKDLGPVIARTAAYAFFKSHFGL